MSQTLSERSIQTIVANVCLTVLSITILWLNPDVFAFGGILAAFLSVNGYEAIKQAQSGSGKK